MDLLSMVMEARKKRPKETGINISDEPTEDEEFNDYTDTGEDDDTDATPDEYADGGDVISDEPADEDEAVDYGEGGPETDDRDPEAEGGNPEGEPDVPPDGAPDQAPPETDQAPPPEVNQGGGITISDQDPGGNQGPAEGGTDYGEGAPEGETGAEPGPDNQAQTNDPNALPPQDVSAGDNGQPPPEGAEGEDVPPEGEQNPNAPPEEGAPEGETPEDDGPNVDEPEKNTESREMANNILLLRSFNRLHGNIRKFIKRVADAKHQSILGSVTYKQVVSNLNELRDMVYKYILLSYDSSTYDENLNNYYYFIEIMHWNLAMLDKVNEIVEKANKNK